MIKYLTIEELSSLSRVIPVVVIDELADAVPTALALKNAGINIIEVTLRTDVALNAIEKIIAEVPDMIVGAGSVINQEQYHQAVKFGAKFVISPGFIADLFIAYQYYDVPFIPGVMTPSEIMQVVEHNFTYLKLFPASAINALDMIKAFKGLMPNVKFCPTGGINANTLRSYIENTNVFAVGCSYIVDRALIQAGQFDKITELSRQALQIANN